jgi:membrane protein DedA with SNARE-associated domain
MTVYFFVGYGEYKAAVFEWSAVQGTTAVAAVLFFIGYASVHFLNKNSDKEKKS